MSQNRIQRLRNFYGIHNFNSLILLQIFPFFKALKPICLSYGYYNPMKPLNFQLWILETSDLRKSKRYHGPNKHRAIIHTKHFIHTFQQL